MNQHSLFSPRKKHHYWCLKSTVLFFVLFVVHTPSYAWSDLKTNNQGPLSIECSKFSNPSVDFNCELLPNSKNIYNIIITDMNDETVNLTETVTNDADGSVLYSAEDLIFDASPTGEQTTVRVRELLTPGAYTYTINAENSLGETDECSFTINVFDGSQPSVSCIPFNAALDETGTITITPEEFAATAFLSDNCSDVADLSFQLSDTDFTCSDLGGNSATFTATDEAGNFAQCSATIVVVDNTPPTAICQPVTVQLDDDNIGILTATQIDNGSSDIICGGTVGLIVSLDGTIANAAPIVLIDCDDADGLTATLLVTDESGNIASCTSEISLETNVTLNAQCRDITVQLDADGNGSIQPADIDNFSTGGCELSFSLDNDSFDCSNVGANIVELTVSDESGIQSCTSVVLVEDNIAPNNICFEGITVELIGNTVTVAAIDLDNSSTDACGIDNILVGTDNDITNASPSITLSCDALDVVETPVTVFFTDVNGNVSTCGSIHIVVEDNTAPTLTCPENTTVAAGDNCTFTGLNEQVIAEDNCSILQTSFSLVNLNNALLDTVSVPPTVISGSPIASLLEDLTLDLGENEFDFETEDVVGNTAVCDFTINVTDQSSPEALCQNASVDLDADGIGMLSIAQINNGSNDNCTATANLTFALDQIDFDCSAIGGNTVMLSVTDVAGNESTCTGIVTVEDNISPTAVCQDITVQLDETGLVTIVPEDVDGGSSDNCSISELSIDVTEFSCDDVNFLVSTILTVTDASGNTDMCDVVVIVNDNIAPVAICQDVTIELDADGTATLLPSDIDNGSNDNCEIDEILFADESDAELVRESIPLDCSLFNEVISVIMIVSDTQGGTDACTATVTMEDVTPPVLTCSALAPIEVNADCIVPAFTTPIASAILEDNCNIAFFTEVLTDTEGNELLNSTTSFGAQLITGEDILIGNSIDIPVGMFTYMVTLTDESGNSSSCTVEVKVIDDERPVVNTLDNPIQLDETGNAVIDASFFDNGTTDNCDFEIAIDLTTFDCTDAGSSIQIEFTATDESGNQASSSIFTTVEDNIAPEAICQDVTVELDANGNGTLLASDVDNGSNDACGIAEVLVCVGGSASNSLDGVQGMSVAAFELTCAAVNEELSATLFVTDVNDNMSSCTAMITVEDNSDITALCADLTVQLDADGNATIIPEDVDLGSLAGCELNFALDNDSFDCADIGVNIVTLTVSNATNSASCTSIILVEDTTPPSPICANFTVQLDENGEVTIAPEDVDNGSSDNCEIVDFTLDITEFSCADAGTITVELTVSDAAGNSDSCLADVEVEDSIAPEAICQDVMIELDADGDATLLAAQVDNGSSDVCGIDNLQLSWDGDVVNAADALNFTCDEVNENITTTLFVTDVNDNTATCTAAVIVEDNIAPSAECQDINITLDATGNAVITAEDIDNGSFDNCIALSFSVDVSNFNCDNTGVNPVELTVTDDSQNTATCIANVTVEDNISPNAECLQITAELDATGNVSLTAADFDDNSSDNCDFEISIDITDFDCDDIGSNTIDFRATDESGNQSACSASVTIEDNIAPEAICQDVTVQIGANGNGVLMAAAIDNGSNDACGIDSRFVSLEGTDYGIAATVNFACDDVNEVLTATLLVTDINGNSSSCTAAISIEDNIAPVFTCTPSGPISVNEDCLVPVLTETIFSGTLQDNCTNLTFTETYTDADGTEFSNETLAADFYVGGAQAFDFGNRVELPLGEFTYSLTFTDEGGNSDNCTFNISVEDNTPPMAICQDITVQLDEMGIATVDAAAIDNGSSDNCSALTFALDISDFTCDNVGANEVTLTATDESGNTAVCLANVTIEDNIAPEAICQDVTVQIGANGNGVLMAAAIDNGSNDACGIDSRFVSLEGTDYGIAATVNFACDDVNEVLTATLLVTDINGNSSNCTAAISIEDNIAPVVTCTPSGPISVNEDCLVPVLTETIFSGTLQDNCTNLTFTEIYKDADGNELSNETLAADFYVGGAQAFDFGNRVELPLGEFTYSLTFRDEGGNSDNCTFNILIEDNTPPMAICQDITAQLDETGNVTIATTDIDNGSTDNCSNPTLTLDNTDFTCADVGANTVTLTATDDSSNTSTCTATVTVEDNVAPMAICQSVTVQLDANGNGTLSAADVDDGSNDACGIDDLLITFDGVQANASPSISIDCEDLGSLTATLFVTDVNGNNSDCTAAISVEDNIDPIAECMDFTVSLDDTGVGSISPIDIDNGSTDNCTETANLVFALVGNTTFSCTSVGENPIILSVTDESNNTGTCTAIVTIEDDSPAVIECRQPVSTTNTPGVCGVEDLTVLEPFALFDNCGAENVTFTRIPAGNDFPIGTTELNWTATDANGNTSTCQSLVIIHDSEAPIINYCNTAIDFVDPGSCLAQVVVSADIFDNCGVASIEGTGVFSLPFGIHPNPITITDVNGNVRVHDLTIFVHDDWNPIFANCPADTVFLQAGIDGTAPYPVQTPVATDNCGVPTITNDLPENGFPIGSSIVTFTAEDDYGNTTDCVVNVEVEGGIALHPQGDIESSLAENETTQIVSWNALNAGTFCELCEETELEDFRYIGTWWGHQYFLANESSLTRDDAALIAEGYDAHLAVINDAAENAYLTEVLDENTRSAWIGLLPELQDEEWTFVWDNGDVFDFEALNFDSITAETRIILSHDGTWKQATDTEEKFFLIERPCVDFVQTGPIYAPEVEEGEEEIPAVLLRSGDAWPAGEYEVTYALTDMCGNEANLNFAVDVLPEIADYCTTVATDNSVWVEEFVFHELVNESEDNEGYADFTEETTTMNIGDGIVLLKMSAGGNEAEDVLYWNVYLDANADGDFFDAGEMLYQIASAEDVETNLTLPVVSLENARLRVMVSRYAFAAPCGDTYVGEIEDYNLNLLIPEDYARAMCEVQVAGLSGERIAANVELNWSVNSACPIENYTLEYSTDGQNFETITQISEQDATDIFYNAAYTTALPDMEGTVTYRIKIQATDQAEFYTNTLSFAADNSLNQVILYPNPADNFVRVALSDFVGQEGRVVIYDNMGKVRLAQDFDANNGDDLRLDLRKFTDGIYHVSIEANAKRTQIKRLIINKLYGWDALKK